MTARSPSAFMLSATLHALFAAVLLYTAYALKDQDIDKAKIFELVAGEGDNYAATEAPALGTPGGKAMKIEMPPGPPAPAFVPPAPEPVAPAEPEPVAPSPVKAVPPPKAEPSPVVKAKTEPTVPNITKNMKRVEARIASKQKAQRDREARAEALAAKQAEIAARKAELMKAGGGQGKVARIDAEGIAKGVLGGSTANKTGGAGGTALSRDEQDLLGTYFALLKQHLRDAHEKPTGLSDLLSAQAEFFVAADGSISRASIVQSSGNSEFDQSVLSAIRNVRTIGRRPDNKGGLLTVRFRMKDED